MKFWSDVGRPVLGLVGAVVGVVLAVSGVLLILAAIGKVTLPVKIADQTEVLAGATLTLVAVGIFAWLANANLAAATRRLAQQAEDERRLRRAHLDVIFDPAQPALWWEERQWVWVMATNSGPAMAGNVVVTLEKIEPANKNPMLAVSNGNRKGINVLPSLLDRKGVTGHRDFPVRCGINPQSREYFDVLVSHKNRPARRARGRLPHSREGRARLPTGHAERRERVVPAGLGGGVRAADPRHRRQRRPG